MAKGAAYCRYHTSRDCKWLDPKYYPGVCKICNQNSETKEKHTMNCFEPVEGKIDEITKKAANKTHRTDRNLGVSRRTLGQDKDVV